ncbi:MAG: hypothetical protein QJR12_01305 [Mycobacterium sp.]|uniref:hypothetical protein n=1 Tax=Mycobacterium sp. TaxID=1785 RepID=UPI0026384EC7|nr:hypothetical protein [Mycobacterium sp.]MDI3312953.1 hypothetical protein [Mycobacterium sp.]
MNQLIAAVPTVAVAALAAGAVALATHANADFVFDICPSGMDGVVAGTPTSCPFADNVRENYFRYGGPLIEAYSPVTGEIYAMDCSDAHFIARLSDGETHPGVLCTGGNDAAVVIW